MLALDQARCRSERYAAALILNHVHVVDRIFVANLQRTQHAYVAAGTAEPPALENLFTAVRGTDDWYVDYVACVSSAELAEIIDFVFAHGANGGMSREETLAHAIIRGGYHRGEVGRILSQRSIGRPSDVFTGYLHNAEPWRREPAVLGGRRRGQMSNSHCQGATSARSRCLS